MFKLIHNFLRNHVKKNLAQDEFDGIYPFNLNTTPFVKYKSFGEKNPDKVFFVIYREPPGSGFFSNFSHVLAYLKFAKENNFIPIVDFKNFKTLYNSENPINGTENAWEYYFKQLSPYSLEEVYQSKHVLFCNGQYPPGSDITVEEFRKYSKEMFNVNQDILDTVKEYEHEFVNHRVLGVHFRGKEMNTSPGHGFGPTEKQIFKCIDDILNKYDIDKIFLVTEETKYLESLVKRYGKKIIFSNALRIPKKNIFNINPRKNHRYLLGREVLVDLLLLLKCQGFLHGSSNIACFAKFLNPNYEFTYAIHNGYNVSNKYVARYIYEIKKRMPKHLGGLLNEVNVMEKNPVK